MIRHPAASTFPPSAPDTGIRADRHDHHGVQYKLWLGPDGLESALYRPDSLDEPVYVRILEAIYDELLRYRGQPERVHRREGDPTNDDRMTCIDLEADETDVWGQDSCMPTSGACGSSS